MPETKLHKLKARLTPTSSLIADVTLFAELLHIPAAIYMPQANSIRSERKRRHSTRCSGNS